VRFPGVGDGAGVVVCGPGAGGVNVVTGAGVTVGETVGAGGVGAGVAGLGPEP